MTRRFKGEKRILGQLLWGFNRFIILFLQYFDKGWRQHKVLLGEKGVCSASLASSSSPTHSVNVILDLLWHVIVDHILYVVDVEAT